MLIVIEDVLDKPALTELQGFLADAAFADGRATAGWAARLVKSNQQALPDPAVEAWRDRIAARLLEHTVFSCAAWPKRIIGPMFARYGEGSAYGLHVDEAILDGSRSDLSFTLFLSDPASYEGGELILDTPSGEDAYKGATGSLVLYPTTQLHRVAPVTRGTRYVAVGWVRSLVRHAEQRELLFDLETARQRLFASQGKTADFDLLSKCASNLMRMWCDD